MCKYVKRFGLSRAHKVPPVLYKVCMKTKFFVTLYWIWNKVKVKMKGMLHIYNDCTIDWHQVCATMWSGLAWVTHTKYHPSYIKYAEKLSFLWPCPGSEIKSRSKWKVCCTSTMIVQLIGTSMCKYVKRFGLSRAHKVPPVLYKVCMKTKFLVTLYWIWNKVKVKMKGMLHIYNDCTIDWHQVCANMWSSLGWVAHTKYNLSYIKYSKFFVTLSWIWNKVKVKMKGMLHIYDDCTTDWHQVCVNMWSGLSWVAHTKYHPSYIKYAEKLSFLWPFPESEMRSWSKWKVCCTSTMIVQLIGIKCVQICEAVWAESRTQSTTHLK